MKTLTQRTVIVAWGAMLLASLLMLLFFFSR